MDHRDTETQRIESFLRGPLRFKKAFNAEDAEEAKDAQRSRRRKISPCLCASVVGFPFAPEKTIAERLTNSQDEVALDEGAAESTRRFFSFDGAYRVPFAGRINRLVALRSDNTRRKATGPRSARSAE